MRVCAHLMFSTVSSPFESFTVTFFLCRFIHFTCKFNYLRLYYFICILHVIYLLAQ